MRSHRPPAGFRPLAFRVQQAASVTRQRGPQVTNATALAELHLKLQRVTLARQRWNRCSIRSRGGCQPPNFVRRTCR